MNNKPMTLASFNEVQQATKELKSATLNGLKLMQLIFEKAEKTHGNVNISMTSPAHVQILGHCRLPCDYDSRTLSERTLRPDCMKTYQYETSFSVIFAGDANALFSWLCEPVL
jgi:hypothetical protein